MNGTGVRSLDLNNLGSSSLGVPIAVPPACKGTECKGESTKVSDSAFTEEVAIKYTLKKCEEKVKANKEKVDKCILETRASCDGVPGCLSAITQRDTSSKTCKITQCMNYIESSDPVNPNEIIRCTYKYVNGKKQLPGTCEPVIPEVYPVNWRCEAQDGTDSATVTCEMNKRR